jgi:hypothetical protein
MIIFIYKIKPENVEDFVTEFMNLGELPIPKEEDQNSFLYSKIIHSLLELIDKLNEELVKVVSTPETKKPLK